MNLAAPELEPLVKIALSEDRVLRQEAFTVGLGQAQLLKHLQGDSPDFESIGVDERADFEAATENVEIAEKLILYRRDRSRQLRRTGIGLSFAFALVIAFATVRAFRMETWVWFATFLVIGTVIGFYVIRLLLRWPPRQMIDWLEEAQELSDGLEAKLDIAAAELTAVQVEAGVKPLLRTYINSRKADSYRTTVTLVEQEGLAELEDPRYAIPTKARQQLDQFLNDMPGGSIGLSGPRGVGKTTLIRSVCPTTEKGPSDRFGFVVSAPVQFDPREFLLHLYGETCRTILGSEKVEELRSRHPVAQIASRPGPEALRWGWPLFAVVGGLLLLFALIDLSVLLLLLGAFLFVGAMLMAVPIGPGRHLRRLGRRITQQAFEQTLEPTGARDLHSVAASRLEDIWFQQTYTTGWSGRLQAPIGEAGMDGTREFAKQQMTLPDIVGDFRRLLRDIGEDRLILIGIDELDKIDSRKEAYRFMNEIKVLFGIDRCFFLVSVSEDAMSAFEWRGMPFRDVFDSSFDDVVNVGFLDVDESVSLLQRRVIGMPYPFIFLCHCVAGGLARDVIRVAREVISRNPGDADGWQLHEACRTVVEADVAAKINASLVATRGMPDAIGAERLRAWLQSMRSVPATADDLVHACRNSGSDLVRLLAQESAALENGAKAPHVLGGELLTYLLYAGALLEFFSPHRSPGEYRQAYEDGRVEQLALARQALAVHPRMAWESLTVFRSPDETGSFPIPIPSQ